jgi:hypothetical protein
VDGLLIQSMSQSMKRVATGEYLNGHTWDGRRFTAIDKVMCGTTLEAGDEHLNGGWPSGPGRHFTTPGI